jgi:hypothetical protein
MRRFAKSAAVLLSVAAAGVFIASPAHADGSNVLTTGSVGGANVAVGDTVSSGLKSGTSATFTTGSSSSVSCTVSQLTATVTSNPAAGGTAGESLTGQTFSSCTPHISGVTSVRSITVNNLSYVTSVNAATGAVTISAGSTGPVQATIVLGTLLGNVTCAYRPTSGSLSGTASNADNSIALSGQALTKSSGSGLCPGTSTFSATYAPAVDTSVAGSPAVFVQ